jgi:hypothetical protein
MVEDHFGKISALPPLIWQATNIKRQMFPIWNITKGRHRKEDVREPTPLEQKN